MASESNRKSHFVDPFEVLMETAVKVTHEEIRREFSEYADIACVYLKGGRSGHINTKTEDGAEKLLSLTKKNNAFMEEKDMKFRIACKKSSVPADNYDQPIVSLHDSLPVADDDDTLPTIHMLNDDVLRHIFRDFDLDELVLFSGVCKRFEELCNVKICDIMKKESIYEVKDLINYFTDSYQKYSDDTACKIIALIGQNLKSLELPGVSFLYEDLKKKIIKAISSSCHSAEKLTVRGIWDATEILEKIPQLKHLEMSNVPNREAQKMAKAILALPTLEYLYLNSFNAWEVLFGSNPMLSLKTIEVLEMGVKTLDVCWVAHKCPNVHTFGFHSCNGISEENVKDVIELLPHLHSLSFTPEDPGFLPPIETSPSIKALHLKDDHPNSCFYDISKQFPNLEQLVLTISVSFFLLLMLCGKRLSVESYGLPYIAFDHFKQLKELYVYGWKSPDDSYAVDSLKKCQNLESIVYYPLSEKDAIRLIKALPNIKLFECKTLTFSTKDVSEIVEICKNRTSKLCLIVNPLDSSDSGLLKSVCDLKLDESIRGHRNGFKCPSFINMSHMEDIHEEVSRTQSDSDESWGYSYDNNSACWDFVYDYD